MISNRKLVPKLRATITVLLADCAKLRTERDDARSAQVRAETRLRDARNTIDAITARVAQADRDGLLTHRGEWPAEVLEAAASAMRVPVQFGPDDDPANMVARFVLDAAARALHHDHVHVAPGAPIHDARYAVDLEYLESLSDPYLAAAAWHRESHRAVGTIQSGLIRTVPDPVARAAAVIGRGKAAVDRLLAGEGHDAVGTTEDSDQETRS